MADLTLNLKSFTCLFITSCTRPRFAVADHCLYIEQMALCCGAFPASRLPCDQLFIYIDVIYFARRFWRFGYGAFGGALLTVPSALIFLRRFAHGAFGANLSTAPVCLRRLRCRFAYGAFGADFPTAPSAPVCPRRRFTYGAFVSEIFGKKNLRLSFLCI